MRWIDARATAAAVVLTLLSSCSSSDDDGGCLCTETTVAGLPVSVDSEDGITVVVDWPDGTAHCEVVGVIAECESEGTLDSEQEEQVIVFATELTNMGGNSQVGQVLPEVEYVRVPGKQSELLVTIEGPPNSSAAFEVTGDLMMETGSECGDCDYWSATLAER